MVLQYAAERYCCECRKYRESADDRYRLDPAEFPFSELGAAARTLKIPEASETDTFRLPVRWLIRELAERRLEQRQDIECLAYEFHAAMAELICRGAEICREQTGIKTAALTGGVMQNTLLLRLVTECLEKSGFCVIRHHMVPPNDGGIALGQAYYLPDNG